MSRKSAPPSADAEYSDPDPGQTAQTLQRYSTYGTTTIAQWNQGEVNYSRPDDYSEYEDFERSSMSEAQRARWMYCENKANPYYYDWAPMWLGGPLRSLPLGWVPGKIVVELTALRECAFDRITYLQYPRITVKQYWAYFKDYYKRDELRPNGASDIFWDWFSGPVFLLAFAFVWKMFGLGHSIGDPRRMTWGKLFSKEGWFTRLESKETSDGTQTALGQHMERLHKRKGSMISVFPEIKSRE